MLSGRYIFPFVLRYFMKRFSKKFNERMNNNIKNQPFYKDEEPYKEGEIKIEYTPEKNKSQHSVDDGDYVNYEEIK